MSANPDKHHLVTSQTYDNGTLNHNNLSSKEIQFSSNTLQPKNSHKFGESEIKCYLKALAHEKDLLRKLMISSILSDIYIQQYNYQQSYKILIEMEKNIQALDCNSNTAVNMLNRQDHLQLDLIKLRIYSNFILIELINLQVKPFQAHLEQALKLIDSYRLKITKDKHVPYQTAQQSQNTDPNNRVKAVNRPIKQQLNTFVMLFQVFLKGLTGFQSIQRIQTETLIGELEMDKQGRNSFGYFFHFSNMSFLKLLSTSDYQAAYKLQSSSYDLIESDIQKTKKKGQQISERQVILNTVILKKLLFLSQELKLPSQIINKYKEKLNSSESLQSKYIQGLQENTIFRNYREKINLGYQLVSRLKSFQTEVILPILALSPSPQLKQAHKKIHENMRLKLWQFKALKGKLQQILNSTLLENNQIVRSNIFMIIEQLQKAISRQRTSNHGYKKNILQPSVEQILLLQAIGYKKEMSQISLANQAKKYKLFPSLYESAITSYQKKLQTFISVVQTNLLHPLTLIFFENLMKSQQSEIKVQISQNPKAQLLQIDKNSETQSEPSIYLENVQFQLVNQKQNNKETKIQMKESKIIQSRKNTKSLKWHSDKLEKDYISRFQIQNISSEVKNRDPNKQLSVELKVKIPKETVDKQKYSQICSKLKDNNRISPRGNIFLNQKNEVYMNYKELGSRVKLNQQQPYHSPLTYNNKQLICKGEKDQKLIFFEKRKNQNSYQESAGNYESKIKLPHQQNISKQPPKSYKIEQEGPQNITRSHKIQQNNIAISKLVDSQVEQKKQKLSFRPNYSPETQYFHNDIQPIQKDYMHSQNGLSLSKSKKKKSYLSPKIPKDSTIHSALTQHIKRHETTYPPNLFASPRKSDKNENYMGKINTQSNVQKYPRQKSAEVCQAGLSLQSKQIAKSKPKIQRLSNYSKSQLSAVSPFQTKTIKFRDYMQNLQKSGLQIRQQQPSIKKNSSKPKILSSLTHRRISTQNNEIHQHNYAPYIKEIDSKQKKYENNNKNCILEDFYLDPQKDLKKNHHFEMPSQDQRVSIEQNNANLRIGLETRQRRAGSQLINSQQSLQLGKQIMSQQQKKMTVIKCKQVVPSQMQQSVMQKKKILNEINKDQGLGTQSLKLEAPSVQVLKKYIMKMTRNHQLRLSHAIKLCENGQYIDKKHYSSDGGDQRFLQLSQDHKFIEWAVSQSKLLEGQKTKYQIQLIKGVVFGKVTQTMRKNSNKNLEPFKCISFIFQKRTFDIYCSQEQDIKFWLPGVTYFMGQHRSQLSHPNYTTKIQKLIGKTSKTSMKNKKIDSKPQYYSLGRVLWKKMLLKMQFKYLNNKKANQYNNSNTGAIIEFGKSMKKEIEGKSHFAMFPPKAKENKRSK